MLKWTNNTYFTSSLFGSVPTCCAHNLFFERIKLCTLSDQPHDRKTEEASFLRLINIKKVLKPIEYITKKIENKL